MPATLAKTTRPRAAKAYPRRRLFRRLDGCGDRPITWVWGPPGAGKTTLVASYLAARRTPSLWYQVDEGDADVAHFFYYLGQAAPRGGRRPALPLLTPEHWAALSTFARRFFRDLFARLGARFVLVLDNFQVVSGPSRFSDVVEIALGELPRGARALIVSRAAPAGRFARLRANQAMHSLGWSDLRLTAGETARVARTVFARLSRREVDTLHASAGGWAAGVVLLAEQAKAGDLSASAPRAATQPVFDYFATEVFNRADPRTREFLLSTAWLPRMTGRMAVALTGHASAGQIVERLHRENYFTSKHGDSEPVYQYHPLFREFLLTTGTATLSHARRRRLQCAAASLLEQAAAVEEAAHLLQGLEDWPALAGLVERRAGALLQTGQMETVARWLRVLPDDLVAARPQLVYVRGLCRQGVEPAGSLDDFERAFASFRSEGALTPAVNAWSALVETTAVMMDDAGPLDRWIEIGEELRAAIQERPVLDVEARVLRGLLIAITMRRLQHPAGPVWAERAETLAREISDDEARIRLMLAAAFYHCHRGDSARASVVLRTAGEMAHGGHVSAISRLTTYLQVARYSWWFEGDGTRALETTEAALAFGEQAGVPVFEVTMTTEGIFAALTAGDAEAVGRLQRRLRGATPVRKDDVARYHYAIGWTAMLRGDLTTASGERDRVLTVALETRVPSIEVLARVFSAHVLRACGRNEEADADLRRAREVALETGSSVLMHEVLLVQADRAFEAEREAEGRAMLAEALRIGREQGYMNVFSWHPAMMARLCVRALEEGIEPDHVRALVRRRRIVPAEPPRHLEPWPWPVKVWTLGRFALSRDGEPVRFARKAPRKPMDLLKALVALGGQGVKEERLTDALWPDADGAAAHDALSSAILRLRRLVGHGAAIQRQAGRLSLDPRQCWVDVWAVEAMLDRADEGRVRRAHDEAERSVAKASAMYEGGFLGDDAESPWAAPMAERLRRRLLRALEAVARDLEDRDAPAAAGLYERALAVEPWAEDVARRLMRLHHCAGRPAEAMTVYERCREALDTWRGVGPAPDTIALYETIARESQRRPPPPRDRQRRRIE